MGITQFIEKVCVQTAVYWGSPVADGKGGSTFADAVEISCRWEEKTQVISDAKGNEIISKAEILLTQDVDEEGWLFLGDLDDLDSAEELNPRTVEGAYRIVMVEKTPLFKSTTEFVHKAFLYKNR